MVAGHIELRASEREKIGSLGPSWLEPRYENLTAKEDHIEWTHTNAHQGDQIYLLFGRRIPVVLGPHEDGFEVVSYTPV
jgi:hypothetical protein